MSRILCHCAQIELQTPKGTEQDKRPKLLSVRMNAINKPCPLHFEAMFSLEEKVLDFKRSKKREQNLKNKQTNKKLDSRENNESNKLSHNFPQLREQKLL